MELILRIFGVLLRILRLFMVPVLKLIYRKETKKLPPIKNPLLLVPAVELSDKIRKKKVSSEEVVRAYIARIKEVNPIINAVVDERFHDALEEAKKADQMVKETSPLFLLQNYPFLGVPFTVKESVGVKGLQHAVGSLARLDEKAEIDGEAVRLLRSAGAIPLCVSNTPEWCMSWESFNHVIGRTLNPYDLSRTPGGSSGGEAALIGSGASLFGPGSDIGGSIRMPALFTGIFGHKPTAGVVSLKGHFPNSNDKNFQTYLTVGPMARYAKDLMPLLHIMTDKNPKLRLEEPFSTRDIKIHYREDVGDKISSVQVEEGIMKSMYKALNHFKGNGLSVRRASELDLSHCFEMGISLILSVKEMPDLLGYMKENKVRDHCLTEMVKCLFGRSQYTFASLTLAFMHDTRALMTDDKIEKYTKESIKLRQQFIEMLGEDGVFFFPTYCKPAIRHYESLTLLSGVVYAKFFNVMGFPSTHVPMGLNKEGLPVGFQVVAAPYQDRLCLAMACELEHAFGGWVPPS